LVEARNCIKQVSLEMFYSQEANGGITLPFAGIAS